MKPTDDKDEKFAGAQILANRVRPKTLALAALIFGIAGMSALWLLVIAGLAGLCALLIALMVGVFRNFVTVPGAGGPARAAINSGATPTASPPQE